MKSPVIPTLICTILCGCAVGRLKPELATPSVKLDTSAISRIDRSKIESADWQEAIDKATTHQRGMGQYSLMRVILEGATPDEVAQAQGTKLKELTAEYHGGGGLYQNVPNGGFVLLQHINSASRRANQDPINIGHYRYGETILWVDVPEEGQLNVVGDVVLQPYPEKRMGRLVVNIRPKPGAKMANFIIGPVAVGGPYGTPFRIYPNGTCETVTIAPGNYKILFSDFDYRKSRWDFSIYPETATRLKLVVKSQSEIEMQEERYSPINPALFRRTK